MKIFTERPWWARRASIRPLSLKNRLRELLCERQLEPIGDMAVRNTRVLGSLIALTYDPDPLVGWRAVEALGQAADRVAEVDPERVREHLRRLHWLLSEESGGVCWRAPEAMAEIVRRRPALFATYVPIIIFLIPNMSPEDLIQFRAGALWAIGRLGSVAGQHTPALLPAVVAALDEPDPQVRGMAVWCLGEQGQAGLLEGRADLLCDEGRVQLYQDGFLRITTVGRLVRHVRGG
ncbi:MAG: DVU0298 family protein [Planctomycetota bacterium]